LAVHSLVTAEKRKNKMEFEEYAKTAGFRLAGHTLWLTRWMDFIGYKDS